MGEHSLYTGEVTGSSPVVSISRGVGTRDGTLPPCESHGPQTLESAESNLWYQVLMAEVGRTSLKP